MRLRRVKSWEIGTLVSGMSSVTALLLIRGVPNLALVYFWGLYISLILFRFSDRIFSLFGLLLWCTMVCELRVYFPSLIGLVYLMHWVKQEL